MVELVLAAVEHTRGNAAYVFGFLRAACCTVLWSCVLIAMPFCVLHDLGVIGRVVVSCRLEWS